MRKWLVLEVFFFFLIPVAGKAIIQEMESVKQKALSRWDTPAALTCGSESEINSGINYKETDPFSYPPYTAKAILLLYFLSNWSKIDYKFYLVNTFYRCGNWRPEEKWLFQGHRIQCDKVRWKPSLLIPRLVLFLTQKQSPSNFLILKKKHTCKECCNLKWKSALELWWWPTSTQISWH